MVQVQTPGGPKCCGRPARAGEVFCPLCHRPFDGATLPRRAAVPTCPAEVRTGQDAGGVPEPRILGMQAPWFHLLAGLALAPIFAFFPLISLAGWFFGAIAHELGHTLCAWMMGMMAFPAISLTAEAAAVRGEPQAFIRIFMFIAGLYGAGLLATRPQRLTARAAVVVLYPLLVFTDLWEVVFLAGGHLGELTLAGIFLWRTLDGGFSESPAERTLYGTMGWYLVGHNLFLTAGLMFSDAAVGRYRESGSFGLKNDYLRLSEDLLGCPLGLVAGAATLLALCVPAVAIWLYLRHVERVD